MNFKIAVKGIIRRIDGKILIVRRSDEDKFMPGIWETVGGGINEKEAPQSALEREIKEEVGLSVCIREPFNVFNFVNEEGEFKIGITFVCDYVGGEIELSDEHSEYEWISPKEFVQYDSTPSLCQEIISFANKFDTSYEKFNVSQKAVIIRDKKCFIAELNKRPGVWDLPGGRIDKREDMLMAFKRELKEETGINNFKILASYDSDAWLSPSGVAVYGTASLIETAEEIILSNEHVQGKWISESDIDDYKYIWPAMNRMIKRGFWYIKVLNENNKIAPRI